MILAICDGGLEDICASEINGRVLEKGRVLAHGNLKRAAEMCLTAKIPTRIIYLLGKAEVNSLKEIEDFVSSLNLEFESFGVKAKRAGEHDFTSLDIARVVGAQIKGKVDLNKPKYWIYAELRQNLFYLGILMNERSLHDRGYKVYRHRASIRPTVAAALAKLAKGAIYDPFAGSGTIPIEARLEGRANIWRSFAFERFMERPEVKEKWSYREVYGSDKSKACVLGAIANSDSSLTQIDFFQADARNLRINADYIVANPPWGKRLREQRWIRDLKKYWEGVRALLVVPRQNLRFFWKHVVSWRRVYIGSEEIFIIELEL